MSFNLKINFHFRSEDLYDTTKFPFFFLGAYELAEELLLVPLAQVPILAKQIGQPKVKIGMFALTARSGSTLLAQMMCRYVNFC